MHEARRSRSRPFPRGAPAEDDVSRHVDATVHVYAEDGPELADYLHEDRELQRAARQPDRVARCKSMPAPIFSIASARSKAGDVVVIAGNNRRKTEFIMRAVDAGMHVLADKPMAIDAAASNRCASAFADAAKHRACCSTTS